MRVEAFNRADVRAPVEMCEQDARNHQAAENLIEGHAALGEMFGGEFATAKTIASWKTSFSTAMGPSSNGRNPQGLRGCGLFYERGDRIAFERG